MATEELQIKIDHAYTQLQRSQQQVKALQAENRDLKTRLLEQSRVSEDAKRAADEYEKYVCNAALHDRPIYASNIVQL